MKKKYVFIVLAFMAAVSAALACDFTGPFCKTAVAAPERRTVNTALIYGMAAPDDSRTGDFGPLQSPASL